MAQKTDENTPEYWISVVLLVTMVYSSAQEAATLSYMRLTQSSTKFHLILCWHKKVGQYRVHARLNTLAQLHEQRRFFSPLFWFT